MTSFAKKTSRNLGLAILLCAPSVAAVIFSTLPALQALYAAVQMQTVALNDEIFSEEEKSLAAKRQIQKHFLDRSVYLPLEDIILVPPTKNEPSQVALLMQKSCGRGTLYIWIPIRFQLPFIGDKVIEWCWKPKAINV